MVDHGVSIEPAEGGSAPVQPSETDRAYFCDYRISEAAWGAAPGVGGVRCYSTAALEHLPFRCYIAPSTSIGRSLVSDGGTQRETYCKTCRRHCCGITETDRTATHRPHEPVPGGAG